MGMNKPPAFIPAAIAALPGYPFPNPAGRVVPFSRSPVVDFANLIISGAISRKSSSCECSDTGVLVLLLLRIPLAGLVGRDCLDDADVEIGEGLSSVRLENRFQKRETAEGPDALEIAPVRDPDDSFASTTEAIAAAAESSEAL